MGRQKYQKHKKQPEPSPQQPVAEAAPPAQKRNNLPYFLVFALGFLLYANTIPFDYALDDKLYITANEFTKKGTSGLAEIWINDIMTGFFGSKKNLVEGGRYRPLALTTHAIEWQLFKDNPHISHFINVVLYGLIGVLLLAVMKRVFGWSESRWWWSIPFVATLLYLAHPLHTEVAANIKSRDEIMSLLFALFAFREVLLYLEQKQSTHLVFSSLWFFASLLSKESSVTFLGVIPLTLLFFPKGNLRQSLIALAPLLAATFIYLALRVAVFADQGSSLEVAQELMNKPYLQATDSERWASIFLTMGIYLKLLVWPHPLTHDYYPFHPFRTFDELVAGASPYADWSNPWTMLSLAAYGLILVYGLNAIKEKLQGKAASIPAYGALIYFGTFILFSNLFFDIGAFMNERFLFIPSLGFAIILAHIIVTKLSPKFGHKPATALLVIIMLGYSVKTVSRNYAWQNDRALATADVATSDGSAKVKMTMGSELLEMSKEEANPNEKQRILKDAEQYCLQSLKIYPQYFPPLDILGNIYFEMGNYGYSVHYFAQAVRIKKRDERLLTNLEAVGNVAAQKGDYDSAIKAYQTLLKYRQGKDKARILSALGELYGKEMNDLPSAKKYLKQAVDVDPMNAGAHQKLGIVYAMSGKTDSAVLNFNRSLEIEPDNEQVYMNVSILYRQLGDIENADLYLKKAQDTKLMRKSN